MQINNLKIRHKLLLLVLFPLLVSTLFAIQVISEKWQLYSEARAMQSIYQFALNCSDVIHGLQKERGLSANNMGKAAEKARSKLIRQRSETDLRILKIKSFREKNSQLLGNNSELSNKLQKLIASLEQRHALRQAIDAGWLQDFFTNYSMLIEDVIFTMANLFIISGDATLIQENQAYDSLLWIQEYAGRERGLVNGILLSGKINYSMLYVIDSYIEKQDSLIGEFLQVFANKEEKDKISVFKSSNSFKMMNKMREQIMLQANKLQTLDQLQLLTGYNGLIHQYKNYVIRGGIKYKTRFSELYLLSTETLNAYLKISENSDLEKESIEQIIITLQKYNSSLKTVEDMRKGGATVLEIDNVVRIDDSQAINAIAKLRGNIPDIDSDEWFSNATMRIDLLKAISDDIRKMSLAYIVNIEKNSFLILSIYILIASSALLFLIYLGATIAQQIARGAQEISAALQNVESSGDFSGQIEVIGNDEIASIGRSFNSLVKGRQIDEQNLRLAKHVFDSTLDGVFIADPDKRIISVNKAFTKITGYSGTDLVGKEPVFLSANIHDAEFFDEMWKSIEKNGSWQGELWNRRKNGDSYPQWQHITEVKDKDDKTIHFISVFSDISAIKNSQEQLEYLAHHDSLTALANRTYLNQHLTQGLGRAKRQKQIIAILFLDLDRFKNINDSLGHHIGDGLLQEISKRLKEVVRTEDLVARLGGDEFAIILDSQENESSVGAVARKIVSAISAPCCIEGRDVYTSVSIGISIFPNDGTTVGALLKHADTAMYHAKDKGRNNFQFYSSEMTDTAVERLALESDIRNAIENEEFTLRFQPQISLYDSQILGVEALIRWNKSSGEVVSPDKFIPVAEECGLIEDIDSWVLHKACEQAISWQKEGQTPICMAINISGFSIKHGLLIDMVKSALDKSGLHPSLLELEITEGYLMQHKVQAAKILDELQSLGIQFSIDDFGTGYSSLGYLKNLPINKLKIDKSFIEGIQDDLDDKAISMAVIALGHSMSMHVIAEGVESKKQAMVLADLGCDSAQGYYYSRPVTSSEIIELIKKGKIS